MRSPKIIALVKAIALSHSVKVDKLHVGYDAAMVMHGLLAECEGIELFVDQDTWSELSKWHKPLFDALGGHLQLPNNVTVSALSSLEVEHTWDTRSEVRVATLESLELAYKRFVDKLYTHRNWRFMLDQQYAELAGVHISRHRRLRHDSKCAELKGFSQFILGIPNLLGIVKLGMGLTGDETLETEIKDSNHRRWLIKLTSQSLWVSEATATTRVGAHYSYNLDNIHRLVQE